MRRRDFIKVIIGSAAGWPCVTYAQTSEGMRRVAVLIGVADDPQGRARFVAFRDGMSCLGGSKDAMFTSRFALRKAAQSFPLATLRRSSLRRLSKSSQRCRRNQGAKTTDKNHSYCIRTGR